MLRAVPRLLHGCLARGVSGVAEGGVTGLGASSGGRVLELAMGLGGLAVAVRELNGLGFQPGIPAGFSCGRPVADQASMGSVSDRTGPVALKSLRYVAF